MRYGDNRAAMDASAAPAAAGTDAVALRGKRLLLADEALKDHVGHFYEYDRAVVEAHRRLNVEVLVAAHRDVDARVRSAIGAEPVFKYTNWDGIYAHPRLWRRQIGIAQHNYRLYVTMRSLLRRSGHFDCVFAPTVTIYHVLGWQALARTELGRSIGRLVLFFRNSIGAYGGDNGASLSRLRRLVWRNVARSVGRDVGSGRIVLATDSERLAEEYRLLAGLALQVFPQPNFVVRSARAEPFDPRRTFTFGCLGPARLEKGVDLLQTAMKSFLAARPDANVHLVIQWNHPIHLEDGRVLLPDPELAADARVRILDRPLDSAEYETVLRSLDCMVLPYRRAAYGARISGVAVEAASAGIPVIYTANTWTADLISRGGAGVAVRDEDADDLARAMVEVYDRREDLTRRARSRAPQVQQAHSPEAFVRALWARDVRR